MIDEIQIKDFALIAEASLSFSPSMTVISGETGTGKSALLSALKLLIGQRGERSAIRQGAKSLSVSGRFFLQDCPSTELGVEHLPPGFYRGDEPSECVVSRSLSADGKSRVSIDGRIASVAELFDLFGRRVDLCGQHEHQSLLKPSMHMGYLDAWGGQEVASAKENYRQAFLQQQNALTALSEARDSAQITEIQLDNARYIKDQIEKVSPVEGEFEQLSVKLDMAQHSQDFLYAIREARSNLIDEGKAIDCLQNSLGLIKSIGILDSHLDENAESLEQCLALAQESADSLRNLFALIEYDSSELEFMRQRMSDLQGLMYRWGPRMEEVFSAWRSADELINSHEDAKQFIDSLEAAENDAESKLRAAAEVLKAIRLEKAPLFARAVEQYFAELEMPSSSFKCSFTDLERDNWTYEGPHKLEFLYSPARGIAHRSLSRIASGGEISRVMLAIKLVLGSSDKVETLVFDEVDAGVGGKAALSLGLLLSKLSASHQIICVTHLPQIAAFAQTHYVVERNTDKSPVQTTIFQVEDDRRAAEIARMLSGEISQISLAHANELLMHASGYAKL